MNVYMNDNVLVLEAETINEAALVGQIRQELKTHNADEKLVARLGRLDFNGDSDSEQSEIHILIGTTTRK